MTSSVPSPRLPVFLFWLGQMTAISLIALVFLAPLGDRDLDLESGAWPRLIALFARDVVVRRTALASAIALMATAFVFFETPKAGPVPVDTPARRPGNVVGA